MKKKKKKQTVAQKWALKRGFAIYMLKVMDAYADSLYKSHWRFQLTKDSEDISTLLSILSMKSSIKTLLRSIEKRKSYIER